MKARINLIGKESFQPSRRPNIYKRAFSEIVHMLLGAKIHFSIKKYT